MRKLILSLSICIPMAFMASGAPLSPEQALGRALQTSAAHSRGISSTALTLSATVNYADAPALYTFNRADNKGFLVVSADDASVALLGYCDEGSVPANPEDMPDGLRYWLDCLAEDIYVNAANAEPGVISKDAPDYSDRTPIGPLVTTKWNQGEPFNNMCPKVGEKRCVTGCVATATAQVLAYHKYPVRGVGSSSYQWNGKELSFDFGATEFDWDNMKNVYTSGKYTAEEADAVATLMYACGVGVKMNYGVGASGAYTYMVADELMNCFGYPEGVKYDQRCYYSNDEWNDLVYGQLRDYGPVLFSGYNSTAGHAFVCDGANENYFHFNWGWGGSSDGYFLLTALNPGSQGIGGSASGYSMNQYIISNVNPVQKHGPVSFLAYNGFKVSPRSGNVGSTSFMIENLIYNDSGYGLPEGSCALGLQLKPLDTSKEPIYVEAFTIDETLPDGYGYDEIEFEFGEEIEDGSYVMTPAFKTVNDGEWHKIRVQLCMDYPYYTVKKEGSSITLIPGATASVAVDSFSLDSPLYTDQKFMFSATVKNETSEEYLNNICAVFLNSANEFVAESMAEPVDIMPGESYTVKMLSRLLPMDEDTQLSRGQYKMYIAQFGANYEYQLLTDPITVKILGEAPEPMLTVPDFTIANNQPADNVNIAGNVVCEEGYFCGNLTLAVFFNGNNIYQVNSDPIIIGSSDSVEGSNVEVPDTAPFGFTANLSSLQAGDTAKAAIYHYSSGYIRISNFAAFTVNAPSGVKEVINEGVESREYISLQGQRFDAKPTLPGIYILRETLTSGKVRTQRVMIK